MSVALQQVANIRRTNTPVYGVLAKWITSQIDWDTFKAFLLGKGGDWAKMVPLWEEFQRTGEAQWSVWAKDGNSKLPFVAFSSLPAATCPGAGDCLDFCYSFRAWRYPNSFFRQVQNFHLSQSANGRAIIKREFDKVIQPNMEVRLFVDGDFLSYEDLGEWFRFIRQYPENKFYGYSKSLLYFLQWDSEGRRFPKNYLLNLSDGHRYGQDIVDKVLQLSVCRDRFIAVPVKGFPKKEMLNEKGEHSAKYRKAILDSFRQIYGKSIKAFASPKLCGSCTKQGHACGSDRFRGVQIVIGIH